MSNNKTKVLSSRTQNNFSQILTLKIEKLQKPEEFNSNFKEKIEEAYNQCKSNDKQIKDNGYAYLKAYYEIEPDYRGLKSKLEDAEYILGKKIRPIDNNVKNKAQNLYTQANKAFINAGTNQTKLQQALALVDQAIDLDSNNKKDYSNE